MHRPTAAASVPANVTVNAGSTTAQFQISTHLVLATTTTTITATMNGGSKTAVLTVTIP